MSQESREKDRVQKIDIDDLSTQVAEKIEVVHDKEGVKILKNSDTTKKKVPLDNIKRK